MGIQAKQFDPSVPLGPWSWAGGQDGPFDVSGTFDQTGDVYASSFHLRAGALWRTNNYRLFCVTLPQIDLGAVLACDGVDAVGATGGVAVPSGTLASAFNGGNGGTAAGDGAPGGGPAAAGSFSYVPNPGGAGSHASGGGNGGAGGAPLLPPERGLCLADVIRFAAGPVGTNDILRQAGLGGGGGGSSDGGTPGGGGGSGAGEVQLWAPGLILAGTVRARGGNGAGGAAPGGGGTGGLIRMMIPPGTLVLPGGTGTFDVSGGLGGPGGNPGGLGLILRPTAP